MLKLSDNVYTLNNLQTDFLENLRKRTVTAIKIIIITYSLGIIILVAIWLLFHSVYCFFALTIPLFGFYWMATYGGKNQVNNHFGFKNSPEGILLYKKEQQKYVTYVTVHIVIFYISSMIRLLYEMHNLKVINEELCNRRGENGGFFMDKLKEAQMLNKHIIVGITIIDHDGTLLGQKQMHGNIIRINENEGIVIKLCNSETEYKLPPDLDSVLVAPAGEYHFKSTGEIVINPDLMTSWTITRPAPNEGK